MSFAIILPSLISFALVAVVGFYICWIFRKPHVFSIAFSDIPKKWSIGALLKLTAVVSVTLATFHTYGIVAAILFVLTLMKIYVVSAKSS